jgi:hypothetical protein
MGRIDFKALSLEFFNQEVIITLASETLSYKKYGKTITGKLVGRIWGEKFDHHKSISTVIALTILMNNEELNIPCSAMEHLEKAKGYQV